MPEKEHLLPLDPVESSMTLDRFLEIQQQKDHQRQEQDLQERIDPANWFPKGPNPLGIPLLNPDGDHTYLSKGTVLHDTHGRILGVDVEAREQIEILKEMVGQLLELLVRK